MSEQIDNTVQEWVATWPKSETLTDYERTLIIGNLNGFYAWLRQQLIVRLATSIDAACANRDAKIGKMRRVLNQSLLALDQLMGDTDLADDDSFEMKTCQAILQVLHEGPLSETDKAWIDDAWERYKMAGTQ